MARPNPSDIISPRNLINNVDQVLFVGNESGFSIAKLILINRKTAIGIRHNTNILNNSEKGYPVVRGHASWFIIPNPKELLKELNNLNKQKKL